MEIQPFTGLALGADFGRTMQRNRLAVIISTYYRWVILVLVSGLLLLHIPLTGAAAQILIGLGCCWIYVIVRMYAPSSVERRLYTMETQAIVAQLALAGVTALLCSIVLTGHPIRLLWALYLPVQLSVSLHARQRHSLAVLAETALLATGVLVLEFWLRGFREAYVWAEVGAQLFAITLAGFLTHSVAHLHRAHTRGHANRDEIMRQILTHVLLNSNGLSLWHQLGIACQKTLNADTAELYLIDYKRDVLQRVEPSGSTYRLGQKLALDSDELAARAARSQGDVHEPTTAAGIRLAAPIYGLLGPAGRPLAVIVLRYSVRNQRDEDAARGLLNDMLRYIGPLFTYASIHQFIPTSAPASHGDIHRLDLDSILSEVLDTICDKLGFSFATVSLVDQNRQEIMTVAGRNIPDDWIRDAHHRLDSSDIQSVVVRTGRTKYVDGWDQHLDPVMWRRYHHADLVRVFVPLGGIGTIEAGFYKHELGAIPPQLIHVLERYAGDVTVAIQNALLFKREQDHAAALTRLNTAVTRLNTAVTALHSVSYDLPGEDERSGERALLHRIADAALEVLDADIVMLYPPDWQAALAQQRPQLAAPIIAGRIRGKTSLKPPGDQQNIIAHIAECQSPYYQPDVQLDTRLTASAAACPTGRTFTFSMRQRVKSFAGVPLIAAGKLLGVLCVNYRRRTQFSDYDRQFIELFAQQAAAVIVRSQLVREQERRQLEDDLHDWVKSSVSGLVLSSNAALGLIEHDPDLARIYLKEVQHTADGILTDIDILLNRYPLNGYDGPSLQRALDSDIERMVAYHRSKVRLGVDPRIPTLTVQRTRTILRIVREAVINAYKYADASRIAVRVRRCAGQIQVVVRDDGLGFDPRAVDVTRHRGLTNMRVYAEELHGTLTIRSRIGIGTTVFAAIPHKEQAYGAG